MIELNDLIVLGLVSVATSLIISVVVAWVARGIRDRDVNSLYKRVESLEMSEKGNIGNAKRAEKNERRNAAMMEALGVLNNPEIKPEDKQKHLLGLAAKYPDVAIDLVKKGI